MNNSNTLTAKKKIAKLALEQEGKQLEFMQRTLNFMKTNQIIKDVEDRISLNDIKIKFLNELVSESVVLSSKANNKLKELETLKETYYSELEGVSSNIDERNSLYSKGVC